MKGNADKPKNNVVYAEKSIVHYKIIADKMWYAILELQSNRLFVN